jgi:hypothetical protein
MHHPRARIASAVLILFVCDGSSDPQLFGNPNRECFGVFIFFIAASRCSATRLIANVAAHSHEQTIAYTSESVSNVR